ncbi:MAG: aminotransferase class I/II-fold pyridoxal phosphate-dependent enzyme [Capnocytophaga sp.]|nr:aminotransferase class I/II-fold pyridoxal phosphate-dependent enzyme [Capnocytophaga sp.]
MIALADRLQTVEEYYFSKKLREVRQMISEGKKVINMGIGSPDFEPLPAISEALKKGLEHPAAHQYQSYQGIPEMRKAMADFYQNKFGVTLNFESEILPLMGSKEGIMHISLAFLNPGDKVLIPNPGYPTYSSVTKLVQAEAVYYNLTEENGWLPDFDELGKEDLQNVKIMWVNYPNMPTGANADMAFYEKLVQFGKKHQILIVNDNPYSFVLNENPISLLAVKDAGDTVLELNSLSKTFNMAGWRIGMLMGSKPLIEAVLKVKSNMDSGMFYPLQCGAVAALQSADSWYSHLNEMYAKRRNLIFKLADALGCTYDTTASGLFVWAKLPESVVSAEAYIDKILQEKHVFITPGSIFGSNGSRYIRFSLCTTEENIEEAIRRVKK